MGAASAGGRSRAIPLARNLPEDGAERSPEQVPGFSGRETDGINRAEMKAAAVQLERVRQSATVT